MTTPASGAGWSDAPAAFDFARDNGATASAGGDGGTASSRFPAQVQPWRNTQFDRYPEIFGVVSNLTLARQDAAFKVLSYGCSTGEEVRTLAERYFHRCRIIGLDVSEAAIAAARERGGDTANVLYDISDDQTLTAHGPYDAIFAMSVLCRWPESKDRASIRELFPFEHFAERVAALDQALRPGGFLCLLYTSRCV